MWRPRSIDSTPGPPRTPSAVTGIDDVGMISEREAAWAGATPPATQPLVAVYVDDDAMLMGLNDRSQKEPNVAKHFLLHHSGVGNDINGNPKAYTAAGIATVYAGHASANFFKATAGGPRVPDLFDLPPSCSSFHAGLGTIHWHGSAPTPARHPASARAAPPRPACP